MRLHPHALAHTPVPKPNTSFEHTALHLKTAAAAHTASSGSGGSVMRTVVGLVIVIAVIYALTWIVRKLKAKDMPTAAGGGDGLERVASLALAPNRSVALVRVGSELHLVGIAEHAVTGIRRFSEDEAIELGLPVAPPGTVVATHAAGTLESLRRRTQR